jgi:hypothetical protein
LTANTAGFTANTAGLAFQAIDYKKEKASENN